MTPIDSNEFGPGLRVKSDEGPGGTLTGDVVTTGSGRLYVLKNDSGAYGFVPAGVLEGDYDVDDSEPAAAPEPTPTNPI